MNREVYEALTAVKAECPPQLFESVNRLRDAIARASDMDSSVRQRAKAWDAVYSTLYRVAGERMAANAERENGMNAACATIRELADLAADMLLIREDSKGTGLTSPTHEHKPAHGGRAAEPLAVECGGCAIVLRD